VDNDGTYIQYEHKKFSNERLKFIRVADQIIREYESKGHSLTVRQLYYQFIAKNLLPNSKKSYNWLGGLISDARLAGLISWSAIIDRNRNLRGLQTWTDPEDALEDTKNRYRIDKWADQQFRPEVWIEKDALSGVIAPICNDLEVDFFACKGYNSQSAQWEAGRRLANYVRKGQRPIIFHLGDHDPSGIDMTRDNQERLSMFAGVQIQVMRLALNMDQIEEYDPPPNYAKPSDSRYLSYVDRFCTEDCWELDALDPVVVRKIIEDAVLRVRDDLAWEESELRESEEKVVIEDLIKEL